MLLNIGAYFSTSIRDYNGRALPISPTPNFVDRKVEPATLGFAEAAGDESSLLQLGEAQLQV